jgi:hypothetical protein
VFVEYAKGGLEDILIQITVANRGPEPAELHVLPTLWFRNDWASWKAKAAKKPALRQIVGLLPLCAATPFKSELFEKYPDVAERFEWFINTRPELCAAFHDPTSRSWRRRLFSVHGAGIGASHQTA